MREKLRTITISIHNPGEAHSHPRNHHFYSSHLDDEIIAIRVASYEIKPGELWLGFFRSLYQMCYKLWPHVTWTDPDISETASFPRTTVDVEEYIKNVYYDHGLDEAYYRSGMVLYPSDNPEIEKRRKELLTVLERRLPPIRNSEAPLEKPSIPEKPKDKEQLDQWFDYDLPPILVPTTMLDQLAEFGKVELFGLRPDWTERVRK